MKIISRVLVLGLILVFFGCATEGQGTAPGKSVSSSAPSAKKLTAEDYKRIGVKETGGSN